MYISLPGSLAKPHCGCPYLQFNTSALIQSYEQTPASQVLYCPLKTNVSEISHHEKENNKFLYF